MEKENNWGMGIFSKEEGKFQWKGELSRTIQDGYQIASVGRVRWEGTIPLMHGLCEVCELFEVRLPS